MASYVEIPAERIEKFLAEKGFRRYVHGGEVVYIIEHHRRSEVKIKVWTTLSAQGAVTRPVGADAIRITAAWEGAPFQPFPNRPVSNSFGIFKAKRVFRTGTVERVLERIYERMREAYEFSNGWLRRNWENLPASEAKKEIKRP